MDSPAREPIEREVDEDLRREAIDECRVRRRAHTCQCGDDLPGYCPGPANCPYSDFNTDEAAHE